MELSPRGLMELIAHEAIVLSPYRDSVGVWTFGVGHTAAAGPPDPARMERGVDRPLAEAIAVFRHDVARYAAEVAAAVRVPLAQHEFDALVSFHFNTGAIGRATLTRLLNEGRRAEAASAFDNWHKPPEIIGRRDKEKALFRDGRYSSGGKATVYPANAAGEVDWRRGRLVDLAAVLGDPEAPAAAPRAAGAVREAPAAGDAPAAPPAPAAGPAPAGRRRIAWRLAAVALAASALALLGIAAVAGLL